MAHEIADIVARVYDLAVWIDAMPSFPHGNDAIYEAYQNAVDRAIEDDETGRICDAWEFALETMDSYNETQLWRKVADALEIELTTVPDEQATMPNGQ